MLKRKIKTNEKKKVSEREEREERERRNIGSDVRLTHTFGD